MALGGYHLGTVATEAEATRIVHEALDNGLDFFDNAWEYHDGKSETWLGNALKGKRDEACAIIPSGKNRTRRCPIGQILSL